MWNRSLEDVAYVHEEINSRLNSGNACYHSVQSFCLPARNVMVNDIQKVNTPVSYSVGPGFEFRPGDRPS
jgi:hypothetical protein